MMARPGVERVCENCGQTFIDKHMHRGRPQRFCSRKCACAGARKLGPNTIETTCARCGAAIQVDLYQARTYKRHYCSRDCRSNRVQSVWDWWARYIAQQAQLDKRECTITAADLEALWQSQGGRCVYTGVLLVMPERRTKNDRFKAKNPNLASVDRIDPAHGYIPGNIQIVSLWANLAKNVFTDAQMREMCMAVARHWQHSCTVNDAIMLS